MVSPEDYTSIEAFGESLLSKASEPPLAEDSHDSEEDVRKPSPLLCFCIYDDRLLLEQSC